MEMESGVTQVKVEPLEDSGDNGISSTEIGNSEPEFIDIKTEFVEVELYSSVKTEGPTGAVYAEADSFQLLVADDALKLSSVDVIVKTDTNDFHQHSLEQCEPTTSHSCEQDQYSAEVICHLCQKIFLNNSDLPPHVTTHSQTQYHCDDCTKQLLKNDAFDGHLNKLKERIYQCETCHEQFSTSSNLYQHKRVHLPEKSFLCATCQKSFALKSSLLKHQSRTRCKPIDEPIICTICNKIFKKEFLLKSHLRRHETGKPFSCPTCNMAFKYKSTLLRHLQLHDGKKPFACQYCEKTFTHLGLLKPHLRVHTGEKPFTCATCSKPFAHKHNMLRHELRHKKVKRLICDVCQKKFPKESRLKYHMRVHINEKYFACFVCPKRFSHRQNVVRHYKRKHPNSTYDCKDTDASVALKVWDAVVKSKYEDNPEEILG